MDGHTAGVVPGDQILRRRAAINAGSMARKTESDRAWFRRTRSSPDGVEDVRDGGVLRHRERGGSANGTQRLRRPVATCGRGGGQKRAVAVFLSGCRKNRANDEGKRGVAAERKECVELGFSCSIFIGGGGCMGAVPSKLVATWYG
jgi:hypothetical protein